MAKKNITKKKTEEKVEEAKEESKNNKNRELYWVLGTMAALVLIFLIFYNLFSGISKFDYQGLAFAKEKYGELDVYRHSYTFTDDSGQLIKYNFFLRNDPRKNKIPIEGKIEFNKGEYTYISVDSFGLEECSQSTIAVASLSAFLTNNQVMVKGATPYFLQSEDANVDYAKCGYPEDRFVIMIEKGNETKIQREGMCYRISTSNCEVLEAVEKFEVQTLLDARERARKRI